MSKCQLENNIDEYIEKIIGAISISLNSSVHKDFLAYIEHDLYHVSGGK